ncbi:phosphoribosylformylglycinamidine cyclo-ligase [Methanobacterium sp. YSL]|nr:phosphoribosylformylglycinamidine cyclo-ligase [Methanobacterium sp. YSL]
MVTYSESGVDIDLEEVTVSALTKKLKKTLQFQDVITESGHFAALVRLGNQALAMSTDGVGSKILVAEMMDQYDTVGIDCVAMVVNDLICVGARPLAMVDYLAVEKPDPEAASQIGEGLAEGCRQANVAMIGGETASLPGIVKNFDLAATGIGLVDLDGIVAGDKIAEDDVILGIQSSGIHSNGLSLARRVCFEEAGLKVDDPLPTNEKVTVGEALLEPTRIYVQAINQLLEKVEVHGLAHITGGGFTNLKRLKKGISYRIDDLPTPHPLFQFIASQGVEVEEMYRVFNMGIGFAVILPRKNATEAMEIIGNHFPVQIIGKVSEDPEEKVEVKTFQGGWIEL